jgi:hypothetical protein
MDSFGSEALVLDGQRSSTIDHYIHQQRFSLATSEH